MHGARTSAGATEDEGTSASVDLDSDRKLVIAILSKNRKAAAEFVTKYSDPLYKYARYRLMPRIDMVDDLVQEVFLAAWDNLESYRGRSSLKSWLLGIARHKVEAHYRRELRRHLSFDSEDNSVSDPVDQPSMDSELDRERARAQTREILADLPESYRLLLFWRYWERRSLAEIASELGKTEKSVERALARSRTQFRMRWVRR